MVPKDAVLAKVNKQPFEGKFNSLSLGPISAVKRLNNKKKQQKNYLSK